MAIEVTHEICGDFAIEPPEAFGYDLPAFRVLFHHKNDCAKMLARVIARGVLVWLSLALGVRAQDADLVPVVRPPNLIAPSIYLPTGNLVPVEAPPEQLLQPLSVPQRAAPSVPPPQPLSRDTVAPALQPPGAEESYASELWLVSTWRLPQAGQRGHSPDFTPDVHRFVVGTGWAASYVDEFVRTCRPAVATTVFVHGNDTTYETAVDGGATLYTQLLGRRAPAGPPTRFVIWSWANEATTLFVRKNAQANALRANLEGYYLATFLSRIEPSTPITLVGYSSGASVVTGGLHILGGGTLAGWGLPAAAPGPRVQSAVLLGAALPNDWLMPGQFHGRAVTQVERLVITVNPYDGVLHWYPLLWGRNGLPALGAAGLPGSVGQGPAPVKVVYVNLQSVMGSNHGWQYYDGAPEVISLLRQELLTLPAEVRQARATGRPLPR